MSKEERTEHPTFTNLIDLAAERVGGRALWANDEFFAPKENLLKPGRGVFIPDKYTDRGKWMDGWETRRRRTPGHDECIVRLGLPGVIRGIDIDTNHFLGNHPPEASLEACLLPAGAPWQQAAWVEILPTSSLQPGSQNFFVIADERHWTHVRLNIYPDGGVARLKVYGRVVPDWSRVKVDTVLDLAEVENGGLALTCSDRFFSDMGNLIMPGPPRDMGDGWETKRRRGPGHDWVILRLGAAGHIHHIEVDTTHFKGNYPDQCSIDTGFFLEAGEHGLEGEEASWIERLPKTKLQAHHRHVFKDELRPGGPCTHVRLNIFPDGGVARLRIFGTRMEASAITLAASVLDWLNRLPEKEAHDAFLRCCGSAQWVAQMLAHRPFADPKALFGQADAVWADLSHADWLEAFSHHPRIGDRDSLREQFASTQAWAAVEQAGTASTSDDVLQALADGNRAYEDRYGYIFIVCATGKTADEMLTLLQTRLDNDPAAELRIAAEEQRKITQLRLEKVLKRDT